MLHHLNPTFLRSLENLYSFDSYTWEKMKERRISTPMFCNKVAKCIVSTPLLALYCASSQRTVLSIPIQQPLSTPPPPPPPNCSSAIDAIHRCILIHIISYINKLKYNFNDADEPKRLSDFIITAMRNRVRWKATCLVNLEVGNIIVAF